MVIDFEMPRYLTTQVNPGECSCQARLVDFTLESTCIGWLKGIGESVKKGEAAAIGMVGTRIVEIPSPCDGRITEILAVDETEVKAGVKLGCIENGH